MKRIYYNPSTRRTAILTTNGRSRAEIIYTDNQNTKQYRSPQTAAQDIRAHGYKLISIKL